MPAHGNPFAALADQLADRRDAILKAWRTAVSVDTTLTSGDSLPHAQLNDHLPAVLQGFEDKLRLDSSETERLGDAAAHGLHRWQQGFGLAEVVRELGRLNECVVNELESLAAGPPVQAPEVMARARQIWAQIYSVAVGASTTQYFKLQQIEAATYTRSLEQGMETLRRLEQQRAHLWREAAHDLRGNLGVVSNATAGLEAPNADPATRESFMRLLGKNVQALHRLLDDVTCLARLQSGQEERTIDEVDVAPLFRELWESLEGHAQQKGLKFDIEGPGVFQVRSDAVKLQRIAQNLVLNAIRYTRRGGLKLSWGDSGPEDPDRWMLIVADTGPGMGQGGASELKNALEVATQHAEQVAFDTKDDKVMRVEEEDAGVPEPGSMPQADAHGEGIGLSIVKRLCELLDATVQVNSDASGTRFEILLPRTYD